MRSMDDFKRPFNIITLLIGCFGIILSIYLYFISQKIRDPLYLVDEQRGKIFDASTKSPAIKVIDKNNKTINDNIYLVTLAFWNNGNLPIEPEHIRRPIRVKIAPIKELLDYTIIKQIDPDISKINVKEISEFELEIGWEHLDPGQGARLQLIYTGTRDAIVSIEGKILDAELKDARSPVINYRAIVSINIAITSALWMFIYKTYLWMRRNGFSQKIFKTFVVTMVLGFTLINFILLNTFSDIQIPPV